MEHSESKSMAKNEEAPSSPIDPGPHRRDFLQSSWIRRTLCAGDTMDRFLSCNRHFVLLRINPIVLCLLYFVETRKA